ncbi:MAG TPA: hypothetical protein VJV78_28755, partial [Polyangiales bacterium]|nr:hypothetical protein [Polyangiales bacterium]
MKRHSPSLCSIVGLLCLGAAFGCGGDGAQPGTQVMAGSSAVGAGGAGMGVAGATPGGAGMLAAAAGKPAAGS